MMRELSLLQGFERLLKLLEILGLLAVSKHLRPIASANFAPALRHSDTERMQRVALRCVRGTSTSLQSTAFTTSGGCEA